MASKPKTAMILRKPEPQPRHPTETECGFMDARALNLGHAAVTLFMCGVIAVIQVVHYPLFGLVGRDGFAAYEARHSSLISLVVGPAMLLEAVFTAMLLLNRPAVIPAWQTWVGAGLLGIVWASTAFLQVPQHATLAGGFDENAHRFLVQSNWVRTLAWFARGALAVWMVWATMNATTTP